MIIPCFFMRKGAKTISHEYQCPFYINTFLKKVSPPFKMDIKSYFSECGSRYLVLKIFVFGN